MRAPSAGDLYGTLRHQPERRQTQDLLQGALSASDQDVLKTQRQTLCYGVCLAIVVALLAALLAFFILHSQSGIRPRALCVSTECKRFALEIKGSLNISESPCRNFYGYVCGHWSKSHPDHVSEVHRRRSEFMDEEAEHLLNCSVPKSNRSAFEKAASLFRECVNGSDVDLETFRASLEGLFGIRWPHPAIIVDPLMLVLDLSMQWQLPVLLRLRNNALVRSGDVSSIVLEGVPMYWWRARVERMRREGSYEGYVREYIRAFKRTPDDDKEFVANVSRRLQTVERHFLDHRDDFFEREGLLEKLTVGELEAKYTSEISTVQWVDAISWAWPHTVNESDAVYLAHPAALELFNSLLLNFSSKDVELFIGWLVIQTLAPSVSLKFRDLLFVNTTVEQGPYSWLTLERCLELTSSLFGVSAWGPLLRERVTPQTRDGAVLLLEAIENSLKARLRESDWMDGQSVDIAQRTIESMKSAAGHPAEVESNAVRYGLYKKVPDLRENFFDSWQQITLSTIPLMMRSWGYADLYTYDPIRHGMHFYDDSHTLAMPDQNLVMPYFHQAAPRAVNMGGLGALVARGFMQAFDRTSESIRGMNRNSWSASSKKAFEDRYACVAQAYGEDWDERIARRQFGDLAAIHSLYKAFSPAPTLRRRLYGLEEFTPDQTFFVSFCHALCVRDPADRVAKARCNVPLMNLRWFSEVFGCRKGERMNPSKRCAFW